MHATMAAAAVVTVFCANGAAAQTRSLDLDVAAPDGAKLRATYYSPGRPGPGMLLLHQCNMDRKAWVSLSGALASRGVHVLALDYRGFGDSPRAASGQQDRDKMPGDVDAAFALLQAQAGVDGNRLAAGGASCGVNNSIQLARRSGKVKALVVLSGTTNDDGLSFLRQHPAVPIFGAASKDDGIAVPSIRRIVDLSTNAATTMRELEVGGHGAPMFDANPPLLTEIAEWVARGLR